MKKILIIITSSILLFSQQFLNAQDTSDYFVGNWNVVVEGTPNGDAKMEVHLERVDGELVGNVKNEGMEAVEISKTEETENTITIYYRAAGYDLYLSFKKNDANNLDGRYLNMFKAKGKRIVEN